ncbi:MAG: AMP-binding protein [Phycisphaerales bacterium]|nr:AMP-binding protein [Phycisphaerales bacterium]
MQLLRQILRRQVRSAFQVAVIDDQRTWRGIDLLGGALHLARHIESGSSAERIGVMLPTSGMFPVALLAGWLLGRTVVPLNYLLSSDEIAFILDDADLDAVVTVGPLVKMVGELPTRVRQIRLDELAFRGLPPLRLPRRRNEDFVAVLLYTSGTSGRPKGVMLTAANLAANVSQCVEWAGFGRSDVMLGVLPQFHSFGLTVLTLLPLAVGCKAVYTARFSPARILDLLRTHRPTAFIAIPSMYHALRNAKSAKAEDFASLRYVVSGAEPLPDAVAAAFRERFGVTINEGYGLTETAPVTNWCRPQEHRPHSVGPALPRINIRIVGPDGRRMGPDEEGEVRIHGPNVMRGYHGLPELTASEFDADGYFCTGDIGRLDRDGHLFITGRLKEMLIIAGENVFPREIEEALNEHPAVRDSAVIGKPDPGRGEVPIAFLELEDGSTVDESSLRAHCRERLPQWKIPREFKIVEKLPRTPTGKILRRELKP